MASSGGVIFENYLYKLTGGKGKSFFSKSNPWKQRYFILRSNGNRPVLEYHSKKPKNKNASPNDKVHLSGGFRLEKVTNTRNRAYVFELTTAEKYLCLSADEQRHMDMFVFMLQTQIILREQIKEDFVFVKAENSEAQRRIGTKGANCMLHVSPWGATLALLSSRSVLAQWPLKSMRYFEASGQGSFLLEAGRVAPMGDGIYVFQTAPGDDSKLYDLLDQHIVDALGKIHPGRRGTTEEVEDYVEEAEKLSALTSVSLMTLENPDITKILKDNWNYDVVGNVPRSTPIVHTRQNSQASSTDGNEVPPPLPRRMISENRSKSSPQILRNNSQGSVGVSSVNKGSNPLADRPPLPPPAKGNTKPIGIPRNSNEGALLSDDHYFRMNSTSSAGSNFQSPSVRQAPDAWSPPPSFFEATGGRFSDSGPSIDEYLTPRASTEMEGGNGVIDYILPSPTDANFSSLPRQSSHNNKRSSQGRCRSSNSRMNRLRSVSCENVNDESKRLSTRRNTDVNQNVPDYDLAKPINPFQNLQDFHGSIELLTESPHYYNRKSTENYYNIQGLRGEIDESSIRPVAEIRRRFNETCRDTLVRSVSNPNFLHLQSKDKLSDVRASAIKSGTLELQSTLKSQSKQKSKSLLNLFRHKGGRQNSKSDTWSMYTPRSMPSSPTGTLTRQGSNPNIHINMKDIKVVSRTRSFRRPKPKEGVETSPQVPRKSPLIPHRSPKVPHKSPQVQRTERSSPVIQRSPAVAKKSPQVPPKTLSGVMSSPVSVHNRGYYSPPEGSVVRHTREGSGSSSGSSAIHHARTGSSSSGGYVRHSSEGSGSQLKNFSRQSSTSSVNSNKVETIC
ncbi:uncharacterized protein LOC110464966 [Mizuhopecten yessoensis]|uniref:uncharacterized protein LOC110464966 n=1 Tax=Mizuhopecten yessoensis TaxID=6573 RepID=UPI000B459E13|nr:uncharacterized protein LOC110464966 [Mizuhopecten yessoensis]